MLLIVSGCGMSQPSETRKYVVIGYVRVNIVTVHDGQIPPSKTIMLSARSHHSVCLHPIAFIAYKPDEAHA